MANNTWQTQGYIWQTQQNGRVWQTQQLAGYGKRGGLKVNIIMTLRNAKV